MQIVTKILLDLGVKDTEINESQLTLLGVEESERENFRELSLGKELSDARAELFVLLCGVKEKALQEKIIQNYKNIQEYRKNPPLMQKREEVQEIILSDAKNVTIYCDGGCTPNPGEAGSGVALYRDGDLSEIWYGLYTEMGTNNTAELGALYESLLLAKEEALRGASVEIKCDSKYSIECIKTWAISWEKKGWTKKGGEIKNLEIIKKAYALYNEIKKDVALSHIKAHAGFEGNELADRMTMLTIQTQEREFVRYSEPIDVEAILKMREG